MVDDVRRAFDRVGAPFLHAGAVDVLAGVLSGGSALVAACKEVGFGCLSRQKSSMILVGPQGSPSA